MPNLDLINKDYVVTNPSAKKYLGDKISGTNLTTIKSRLDNKDNLSKEESEALDWITKKYEEEIKRIDSSKRTKMRAGDDSTPNAFKKTHTKDGKDTEVAGVNKGVKLTSSGKHSKVSDQIENNRVQYYESISLELNEIKYLIEYMNK
tara:strand:+ start:11918 stop:12361 length:444 start_codon:yes stop_codon:yes gene_type:complete